MTLAATAKKLGVSFVAYVHNRIARAHQIPPLADLISARLGTPLTLPPRY